MPMRGLRGDRLTPEALVSFCSGKLKEIENLAKILRPYPFVKGKGLLFEVEAAQRAYMALLKGDEEKAMKWFRCLPNSVGKVCLYSSDIVVHLGIGYTHEYREGKMVRVGLARAVGSSDPWEWVYVFDTPGILAKIQSGEYELKAEHSGINTCIGWSELLVKFEDELDARSSKSIKVGAYHECGETYPASEPFHRVRCKSCSDLLQAYRSTQWTNFLSPSKDRKGLSKDRSEKGILDLLKLLG